MVKAEEKPTIFFARKEPFPPLPMVKKEEIPTLFFSSEKEELVLSKDEVCKNIIAKDLEEVKSVISENSTEDVKIFFFLKE